MKNSLESWKLIEEKIDNFTFKRGLTSFVNPFSMLALKNHRRIAQRINNWYIDGQLLVVLFNLFSKKRVQRYSFDNTSIAPIVFNFIKENKYSVAIIGSTQENIEKAVSIFQEKYDYEISYFHNGYFSSQDQKFEVTNIIINKKCDVVICGMGVIYQEEFLILLQDQGWDGFGFTCGGFIHQTAKKDCYYPKLINKLHLRWLYRMVDEPKLIKRYVIKYPIFIYYYVLFKMFTK